MWQGDIEIKGNLLILINNFIRARDATMILMTFGTTRQVIKYMVYRVLIITLCLWKDIFLKVFWNDFPF